MANPGVSVITTVLNCENFISQSIESITSQTFTDFEYIIVNDGSTDKTSEIIHEHSSKDRRLVAIDNATNLGRVKSLNIALERAKGKYIALQDADDISLPLRLERQFEFMEKNPDYVLVGANIVIMDEYENFISKPIRPENNLDAKFSLLFKCTFANPSIMYRKKIIDENNLKYEDNFIHAEDFRIISLISRYGKVYNLMEPLIKYRKHGSNNSILNFDILNSGSVVIVKDNLAKLGLHIEREQIYRIRDLVASRGISKKYIYEDVKFIFKTAKSFQSRYRAERNEEILYTLIRISKWLGKKNVLMKPKYLLLYLSIMAYYLKESFYSGN